MLSLCQDSLLHISPHPAGASPQGHQPSKSESLSPVAAGGLSFPGKVTRRSLWMGNDCSLSQQFQNRAPCKEASSKLHELELKAACEVQSL